MHLWEKSGVSCRLALKNTRLQLSGNSHKEHPKLSPEYPSGIFWTQLGGITSAVLHQLVWCGWCRFQKIRNQDLLKTLIDWEFVPRTHHTSLQDGWKQPQIKITPSRRHDWLSCEVSWRTGQVWWGCTIGMPLIFAPLKNQELHWLTWDFYSLATCVTYKVHLLSALLCLPAGSSSHTL